MGRIEIRVADLDGLALGEASDGAILIDRDAAGWGWFIDATPGSDSDSASTAAQGRRARPAVTSIF
jgi:hypothetical protein